ncbi:MAG TPA: hypothetical protein VMV10_19310 [Pirellulales bacterium]|nr:hypothetical protein [Pirellulales bacterium]
MKRPALRPRDAAGYDKSNPPFTIRAIREIRGSLSVSMRDAEHNATPENAKTFSLGCLLRAVTLVSMALGCLSLIPTAPPQWLLVGQIALGFALATVIGVRRRGTRLAKFKSAAGFFWMACLVACYCGYAAFAVQNFMHEHPDPGEHQFAVLDRAFPVMVVVAGVPIVALLLILLLRSWTWAAHDREIAATALRDASMQSDGPPA